MPVRPPPTRVRPGATRVQPRRGSPVLRLSGGRLRAAAGLLAVLVAVLVGRLVQLQGFESAHYATLAQQQRLRTITLLGLRGTITDRGGVPLAESVDARDVYADPAQIHDVEGTARALSPLLHLPVPLLARKLQLHGQFVYLARGVLPAVANQVMALQLPGVGDLPTTKRVYPDGGLASNVIGFVGTDGNGLTGLEWEWNRLLLGTPGSRTFEVGADGRPIPDGEDLLRPAVPGDGLRLTLDSAIQWEAQRAITAQVQATGATDGSVIVMNPRTGELLALATAPGFNANDPGAAPAGAIGDPPVQEVYEPGSVNKVITMSAALQTGVVTPDTPVTVPPTLFLDGTTFHDAEPHGTERLTVTGVLAESSNIGTIEIAEKLGPATLYHYLRAYGFGRPTGSALPGESAGLLPPPAQWSAPTLPTVAFGQGIGVTALQVAAVYATIANGGVRITPHIVAGTVDRSGRLRPFAFPSGQRVISPTTAAELRDMLESVTSDLGTAPAARIDGYRVAGKTGTAQRPDGHGGYSGYTASFVGFAPADDPQLLVEVVLQNPVRGHFGGAIAAPVFHDVADFALQSLRIPPTGTRPPVARLTAP